MAEVTKGDPAAIVFTGFMAAGKSEAAGGAAERLGVEAFDADALIEAELGEPIADFFAREGEVEFRRREEKLVLDLLGRGGVISLGGGAVESEPIREALAGHVVAWCQVSEEDAWERSRDSGRPLAVDREEFARRHRERMPLYEATARAILPEGGAEIGAAAAPWLDALRSAPAARLAWAASDGGSYPAIVGEGAVGLLEIADPERRRFLIGDRDALAHHADLLPGVEATLEIDAGEERKTLAEAETLLRALADAGARRDDQILAFGGGVTGDLAGFVAATYQRGAPLAQLPTTVVAQVDSAYGGKTGVDLPEAKNYVGAYHQPEAVLADPATLATLPEPEIAAGFVEVLKTALIAGGELWKRVEGIDFLGLVREGDRRELAEIVFACARAKIEVVAADERDAGRRATLNLGHTVGHAIESASGYSRYRHGEAVGLGLLAALRLSDADELRERVRGSLEAHGLPVALDGAVDVDVVLEATGRDKKRTGEGLGFVLLETPGEPRWGERVEPDRVRAAVEELTES